MKSIHEIIRSVLIDAGYFGTSTIRNGKQITRVGDKDIILTGMTKDEHRDTYLAAVDTEYGKTVGVNCPDPLDAFRFALKRYRDWYGDWRSPHGRPIPDHYFDAADDEARRIMKEAGIE